MEEKINLIQCIGGNEFTVQLPSLNDLERNKLLKAFYDKKPIKVNVLDNVIECYISFLHIKKVQ